MEDQLCGRGSVAASAVHSPYVVSESTVSFETATVYGHHVAIVANRSLCGEITRRKKHILRRHILGGHPEIAFHDPVQVRRIGIGVRRYHNESDLGKSESSIHSVVGCRRFDVCGRLLFSHSDPHADTHSHGYADPDAHPYTCLH
jgi:hypothetical protein